MIAFSLFRTSRVDLWYSSVSGIFLRSYLEAAQEASFIPNNEEDVTLMLEIYLLEKAVYEVGYELNNRPDWVRIPLKGIKRLMEE